MLRAQSFSVAGAGFALALLGGCAPTPPTEPIPIAPDLATCSVAGFTVDFEFPAAGDHACSVDRDGTIAISVAPEDEPPINCSAWYAFRIVPEATTDEATVRVRLEYAACGHRYRPKISENGTTWSLVPEDWVEVAEDRLHATLTLYPAGRGIFVSAQELLPLSTYETWLAGLGERPDVTSVAVGSSVEGRNITGVAIGNPDARRLVVIVGRQHPPEVTGALALFPFVETILSDHPIAREFRSKTLTVVVPVLNPDGVENGHWRHNMGGTDLNRDWGPFAQPETRAMRDLLDRYVDGQGKDLQILIDFHSTGRDVFYTLPDDLETTPAMLTQRWLDRLEQRMPGFAVNRDPGHNPDSPVSKAYAFERFGAPGVTFELGDETDRDVIVQVGQQSAFALMGEILSRQSAD